VNIPTDSTLTATNDAAADNHNICAIVRHTGLQFQIMDCRNVEQ